MLLTQLVIAALAVWEAVEIYHHSPLFAGVRARVEILEGKLHTPLECPFCMSPWVSWLLVLPPVLVPSGQTPQDVPSGLLWGLFVLWRFLVYGLAVARLANLGNDVFHALCRTPRDNKDVPPLGDPKTTLEEESP